MRIVFADVETTGIRPDMGAEIWELGLIVRDVETLTADYEIRKAEDEEWAWHLRPDLTRADPMALGIGGYYERNSARRLPPGMARRIAEPAEEERDRAAIGTGLVAAFLAETLSGAHLVAANPGFDAGHLDALLRRHGEVLAADYHYTDLGSLVRGWAHGSFANPVVPWPLKLADAARLARIDPGDYDLHTALGDARLARDVFDAVTGGAA